LGPLLASWRLGDAGAPVLMTRETATNRIAPNAMVVFVAWRSPVGVRAPCRSGYPMKGRTDVIGNISGFGRGERRRAVICCPRLFFAYLLCLWRLFLASSARQDATGQRPMVRDRLQEIIGLGRLGLLLGEHRIDRIGRRGQSDDLPAPVPAGAIDQHQ